MKIKSRIYIVIRKAYKTLSFVKRLCKDFTNVFPVYTDFHCAYYSHNIAIHRIARDLIGLAPEIDIFNCNLRIGT